MSNLNLLAFTYGSNDTRAEIEFRPVFPEAIRGDSDQIDEWARTLLASMYKDLKHTDNWTCEICGDPARDAKYDIAIRTHLPTPDIVLYIHSICEEGNNLCTKTLQVQSDHMASLGGLSPGFMDRNRLKPASKPFPLSGSCLNCQEDNTVNSTPSRCGGCKLVRYCSTECQSADWKRHKKICKVIKSVKWADDRARLFGDRRNLAQQVQASAV
ncbi:hypothetical protein BDN70DRAFT_875130 [Pholiota conissans]|uniref:MYND-type domain-containing protein n=1 Tax=Pholiota conissans TaxID=109636 RepID=A0A9P5Z850_9AGAR|nr:hypothetical protein BDN70DRAFT_875130 [Pholiota conissans]